MSKKTGNFLNPYDVGVRKAIALSRESLAPTVEQTHASLNDALATFGAMLSQIKPGAQKGLFNNLASIAPAAFPAVQAYNKAQKEAREQNKILANEHQNYARDEAMQAAKAQEYATEQEWKQKNFDLSRFHAAEQARHNKAQEAEKNQANVFVGGKNFLPLDKTEMKDARKTKINTGNSLLAVKEANKKWEDLDKKTKHNIFKPIGSFSGVVNPIKDWSGQLKVLNLCKMKLHCENSLKLI